MNNVRSRFRELADHLKKKSAMLGVAPENVQAEIATMVLARGGHNETEVGWHLADLRYRGVLLIERIRQSAAVMVLMHCRAWLDENDDTRARYNLDDPEINLIPLDASELVDLVISCDFVDPVFLAEAENGEVHWNGRSYAPVEYDLRVAERGEINGGGTDV